MNADVDILMASPKLPDIVSQLSGRLEDERKLRERFYDEFEEGQKAEFINGEVIVHSPATDRHNQVRGLLERLCSTFVDARTLGSVRAEKCLCVFPRNDYEPDVVFFGREKASEIKSDTRKNPVPDFVIEVLSESTAARDRGVKFEDYEAHGVGEYWIVDPEREMIEQYSKREDGFELLKKSADGILESEVVSGFRMPVRAAFDAQVNLEALRGLLEGGAAT